MINPQVAEFNSILKDYNQANAFSDKEKTKLLSAIQNALDQQGNNIAEDLLKAFQESLDKLVADSATGNLNERDLVDLAKSIGNSVNNKEVLEKVNDYLSARNELDVAGMIRASQEKEALSKGDVELALALSSGNLNKITPDQQLILDYASQKNVVRTNLFRNLDSYLKSEFGDSIKEIVDLLEQGSIDSKKALDLVITKLSKENKLSEDQLNEFTRSVNILEEANTDTIAEKIAKKNNEEILSEGFKNLGDKLDGISTNQQILDKFRDARSAEDLGSTSLDAMFDLLANSKYASKLGLIAKAAVIAAGGGFLVDGLLGKAGVGKDENGNDIVIDERRDASNWSRMNWWEKTQSGIARGIEKAGSLLFMDNMVREARSKRIENESKYLDQRSAKNTPSGSPDRKMLDFIGGLESNGNYNALVYGKGTKKEDNLTGMTIGQVMEYQKSMIKNGHASTAVGKYQFISSTLKEAMKAVGLTENDMFSPENQDKMGMYLLNKRGWSEYKAGRIGPEEFANRLGKEWASLPNQNNRSHYAGIAGNATKITHAQLLAGISNAVSPGLDVSRSLTSPEVSPNPGSVALTKLNKPFDKMTVAELNAARKTANSDDRKIIDDFIKRRSEYDYLARQNVPQDILQLKTGLGPATTAITNKPVSNVESIVLARPEPIRTKEAKADSVVKRKDQGANVASISTVVINNGTNYVDTSFLIHNM